MSRFDSLKWFVYYPVLVFIVISTVIGIFLINKEILTPLHLFESPLRAGDRVFLLTGQWHTKVSFQFNRITPSDVLRTTDLLVELWSFDSRTAAPMWRKRLRTVRKGAMQGYKLVGAEGDILWVSTPDGPIAASMTDGTIRAAADSIVVRNPHLKGLIPVQERFYQFDAEGLLMTAADARRWRFDPNTFLARAGEPRAGAPRQGVVHTSYMTPNSTMSFLSRSLDIPGKWLGLLNEDEVEIFRKSNAIGGIDGESRRRLYGATATEATNFFGKYLKYSNFKPLGRDFLGPGLLSDHRPTGPYQVIWVRNPDSVLVLHRDRLGEEGKLKLARVAGPEGQIVWEVALPLSVLQAVLPGEGSVALFGAEFTPRKNDQPRDPLHDALERLIGIDLASGVMHVHDLSDVTNHIKATPENEP